MKLLVLGLVAAACCLGTTLKLQSFDPLCDGTHPAENCRGAFQRAFASLATTGGTVSLPAGTFLIDYPDLSQNVTAGFPVTRATLLVVPPHVQILGAKNQNGSPATTITWSFTSVPIFIFAKSSRAAMRNIHGQFTGTIPTYHPYGDINLLQALGYPVTFPHQNQMSGGNNEMQSFVYEFDSDNCIFDNIWLDAPPHDGTHLIWHGFNIKGKGVITQNGGGLSRLAYGNVISHVHIQDHIMGILIAGQDHLTIDSVSGDWRGSVAGTAPGHLIYTTLADVFDASGAAKKVLSSTNSTISNIVEAGNTYGNSASGGTLAIKALRNSAIINVQSGHPEGLIQTIYDDQNDTFTNLNWYSTADLCTMAPDNCSTPVIYSTAEVAPVPKTSGLTFRNVSITSTVTPITTLFGGDNLVIDNIRISTPMTFLPGQSAANAVLGIKGTSKATITRYTIAPITQGYDPNTPYNLPFEGWAQTSNAKVDMTVVWPGGEPLPPNNSGILNGTFQTSTGNTISTSTLN